MIIFYIYWTKILKSIEFEIKTKKGVPAFYKAFNLKVNNYPTPARPPILIGYRSAKASTSDGLNLIILTSSRACFYNILKTSDTSCNTKY